MHVQNRGCFEAGRSMSVPAAGAALLGLALLGGAAIAGSAMAGGSDTRCYDFDSLPMGQRYHVGDVVGVRDGAITLRQFLVADDTPFAARRAGDEQYALVQRSSQVHGVSQALRMRMINAGMTSVSPVRKVDVGFAEYTGGVRAVANVEVNGDRHVVRGALAQANGKEIGDATIGKAAVVVTYRPMRHGPGLGRGTLRLYAIEGAIRSWSIGGSSEFFIDNVCLTR